MLKDGGGGGVKRWRGAWKGGEERVLKRGGGVREY